MSDEKSAAELELQQTLESIRSVGENRDNETIAPAGADGAETDGAR